MNISWFHIEDRIGNCLLKYIPAKDKLKLATKRSLNAETLLVNVGTHLNQIRSLHYGRDGYEALKYVVALLRVLLVKEIQHTLKASFIEKLQHVQNQLLDLLCDVVKNKYAATGHPKLIITDDAMATAFNCSTHLASCVPRGSSRNYIASPLRTERAMSLMLGFGCPWVIHDLYTCPYVIKLDMEDVFKKVYDSLFLRFDFALIDFVTSLQNRDYSHVLREWATLYEPELTSNRGLDIDDPRDVVDFMTGNNRATKQDCQILGTDRCKQIMTYIESLEIDLEYNDGYDKYKNLLTA